MSVSLINLSSVVLENKYCISLRPQLGYYFADQAFKDPKTTFKPLNVKIIVTQTTTFVSEAKRTEGLAKWISFVCKSDSTLYEGSKHIETTFTTR